MLHLFRYHIGDEKYFVGITTPASALIVISISFLSFPQWSVVLVLFVLSVLMVINVPYPRVEGVFSVIAVILIFLTIIFGDKYYAVYFLLLGTVIYALIGPFYLLHGLKKYSKMSSEKT
jgi:phosphatidylserine synthase